MAWVRLRWKENWTGGLLHDAGAGKLFIIGRSRHALKSELRGGLERWPSG